MYPKRVILMMLFMQVLMATSCQAGIPMQISPTPTLASSLMDTSLFTNVPCGAPCWFGLEPGKSTEEEVIAALQELSFIDPDTLDETSVGYWDPVKKEDIRAKLISANCVQPENRQCVGLTVANNSLRIIGLFPNYAITFEDLLNRLGTPDNVIANLIPPVHQPGCSVGLMWTEQQIVADHTEKSTELCDDIYSGKRVNPSLLVHSITYFLPEYMEFMIKSDNIYPWVGFVDQ